MKNKLTWNHSWCTAVSRAIRKEGWRERIKTNEKQEDPSAGPKWSLKSEVMIFLIIRVQRLIFILPHFLQVILLLYNILNLLSGLMTGSQGLKVNLLDYYYNPLPTSSQLVTSLYIPLGQWRSHLASHWTKWRRQHGSLLAYTIDSNKERTPITKMVPIQSIENWSPGAYAEKMLLLWVHFLVAIEKAE